MSTYIDPRKPNQYAPHDDVPKDVRDFLSYLRTILNRSPRTVNGYYIDLRTFFKFIVFHRGLVDGIEIEQLEPIVVSHLDTAFIASITQAEIYEYLYYLTSVRKNDVAARSRKLTALKSFYKYMTTKANRLEHDPTQNISMPSAKRALPKYLSLEESIELLKNIQSDFYERDFCMVTMFLNCGMRLTELVTINLSDISEDTIRITGKGNKQRLVYLNKACIDALEHYKKARASLPNLQDKQALFVSARTGKRLSPRRVQQIIDHCMQTAGLANKGYSTHKLRHTAATLMYRHGNVDMLELKEILGHENVATTEIYTHMNSDKLREAVKSTPLSSMKYMPQSNQNAPIDTDTDPNNEQNDAKNEN